MNTKISIRQILFLYIFISITPIFTYIPNTVSYYGENTGYLGVLYGGIVLLFFAALILQIINKYPDYDLYDMLRRLFGITAAKCILFLYGIWAFLFITFKVNTYTNLLQTTLMPTISNGILIVFLFLLVINAISKGKKTIFRFAEFLYGPILLFLLLVFIIATPTLKIQQLIPITVPDLSRNLKSIPILCSIGGNIVLLLFFSSHLTAESTFSLVKKRTYFSVAIFTLLAFLATIAAIGINGSYLTGRTSFPIFQTAKGLSVLNAFERFDSFITLVCILSDFVTISIFLLILMQCFSWVFNITASPFVGAAFLVLSCVYVMIQDATQFQLELFHNDWMIGINLVFQFVLPSLLGILCIFKKKDKHN
ncbi:GerAB/ArcD/ProY family transporter [Anaeromicropila populeti]|uniref:Spore germination protein (Amino acid permease) n=1 Tax=Anaeromicropila populeti TaxID=37658 RepID=A0A1I6JVK6_9FIRM|nr:GerAB/ArcD/ProY family transporter [Anaeromicropila populeti]SFR83035.1 spore germination protein (amino acid permease) [Anaeromicropila populeti]